MGLGGAPAGHLRQVGRQQHALLGEGLVPAHVAVLGEDSGGCELERAHLQLHDHLRAVLDRPLAQLRCLQQVEAQHVLLLLRVGARADRLHLGRELGGHLLDGEGDEQPPLVARVERHVWVLRPQVLQPLGALDAIEWDPVRLDCPLGLELEQRPLAIGDEVVVATLVVVGDGDDDRVVHHRQRHWDAH